MTETERAERNLERLSECDVVAARRFARLIAALEAEPEGFRPRIQEAWRSAATHAAQLAAGTSLSHWSQHMATGPNGEKQALAIDLLDDDYPEPAASQHVWPASFRAYLIKIAWHAATLKLRSGILWELEPADRAAMSDAVMLQHWQYQGKFGFDPTHVEVSDVTYPQGEAGQRPHKVGG
jgi:hypothetical protein